MTTVRKKGTFRAQHAEKVGRAAQNTPLPPRCRKCRLPGSITVTIDSIAEFYCVGHAPTLSIESNEWECGVSIDHDWKSGDYECRRCGADLSEWNEDQEEGEEQ